MVEDDARKTRATSSRPMDPQDLNLEERYKRANLPYQKDMYLDVLALMLRYSAQVEADGHFFSRRMHDVLTSTPVEILSYQFDNKETAPYSIELFKAYKEYNLDIIKSSTVTGWERLSESERGVINLSMYMVFAAIDPVLKLYDKYSKANSSPYETDGNLNLEFDGTLRDFNKQIEEQSFRYKNFPTSI